MTEHVEVELGPGEMYALHAEGRELGYTPERIIEDMVRRFAHNWRVRQARLAQIEEMRQRAREEERTGDTQMGGCA